MHIYHRALLGTVKFTGFSDMVSRIIILFIFLFASRSFANCQIVESIKGVNVRTESNSSSEKVGYFSKGHQYALIEMNGNWAKFWYDGSARWAYAKGYLEQKTGICRVLFNNQPVLNDASNDAELLATLPASSIWAVHSVQNQWQKIWFNNQLAYIEKPTSDTSVNILSKPNKFAFIDSSYFYKPMVSGSLRVNWQIISGPEDLVLDDNRLHWKPGQNSIGEHTILLKGVLQNGEVLEHSFNISVLPVEQGNCEVVESYRGVNIRASSSSSSDKIGYFSKTEQKPSIASQGNWENFWHEGQSAWSYAKGYLSKGAARCIEIDKTTAVKVSADIDSNLHANISAGAKVVVIQEVGEWYQVRWQKQLGYISKESSHLIPVHNNWTYQSTPNKLVFIDSSFRYSPKTNSPKYTNISLLNPPRGMEIKDNIITWKPTKEQIGIHNVQLISTDVGGAELIQRFDLEVLDNDANSCHIVESYRGVNVRADADSSSEKVGYFHIGEQYHLINLVNKRANIWFDSEPRWAYANNYLRETQATCATIKNQAEVLTSEGNATGIAPEGSKWVILQETNEYYETWYNGEIGLLNKSDVVIDDQVKDYSFTSIPSNQAFSNTQYTYALAISHNEQVEYSLEDAPVGMTLDNGVVKWTPTDADFGRSSVVVKAEINGISIMQSFELDVSALFPNCNID